MAGMTRKEAEVQMLRACAESHGVSERSVRNWRNSDPPDPRWLMWKREWGKKNGFPALAPESRETAGPAWLDDPDEAPPEHLIDDGFGEGIEAEILRAKAECKRLAIRCAWLEKNRDFEGAALLHRVLDAKRDGLRKLAGDNPDILAKAGDLVPRTVLLQYCAAIRTLLSNLPQRLMAWVPDNLRDEIRPQLESEIGVILRAAEEVDIPSPA